MESYQILLNQLDQVWNRIIKIFKKGITCYEGCSHCCTNLTVFPVEFYAIKERLSQKEINDIRFDPDARCGFLKKDLCQIYPLRPVICRTHGLPIIFLNDDSNEPGYNLSFCERNFPDTPWDQLEFDDQNTLNIDQLNTTLFQLNQQFIQKHPELNHSETDRIPLKALLD